MRASTNRSQTQARALPGIATAALYGSLALISAAAWRLRTRNLVKIIMMRFRVRLRYRASRPGMTVCSY